MNSVAQREFYQLKDRTIKLHTLIKTLQAEAKGIVDPMKHVTLATEIEVLKKTCDHDLNKLQLLGLKFLNHFQNKSVGQAIQKLRKEIE